MTVAELITALRRYPEWAQVQVFAAEGTYQHIIEVDDNTFDGAETLPLVVYISSGK